MPEFFRAPGFLRAPFEDAGDTRPARSIAARIREKGPITFSEFMAEALYGDGGYYTTRNGDLWGGGGDYVTSIDVSPVFASTLARQVVECWEALGSPSTFTLVEAGAGRGTLSKGVISSINETSPALSKALKAVLVEKNPHLRSDEDGLATWKADITEIEPFDCGVVLSNELIDSLPVHRVFCIGGEVREIYAGLDGEAFCDYVSGPSTEALPEYLKKVKAVLSEGQRAEINLNAAEWVKRAASLFSRGFIITIDYGFPSNILYAPERLKGTLLCHYRHAVNDNPYLNIGLQDITAHADFTALAVAGREAGAEVTGFTTQKDLLLGLGIAEYLRPADGLADEAAVAFNRAVGLLINPGGMGDTFKALIQHKGIERPLLSGFSFKDRTRSLFQG